MRDCYFCRSPLEPYRQKDLYDTYMVCTKCPKISRYPTSFTNIWESPCIAVWYNKNKTLNPSSIFLTFDDISLQLNYYCWQERSFIEVRDLPNHKILYTFIGKLPNLLETPILELKNKLQTWVTFS